MTPFYEGSPVPNAGGTLVDTRKEYSTILSGLFHRIILDEGHKIENPQTLASNMVVLLKVPYKWILTATPMMNQATDYVGYLFLLWDPAMAIDERDQPTEYADLYTDNSLVPQRTAAYLPGGRYEFSKFGLPLWRIDPYHFKYVISERQVDLTALTAYRVLRGITQLITLRRTQATIIDLGDKAIRPR